MTSSGHELVRESFELSTPDGGLIAVPLRSAQFNFWVRFRTFESQADISRHRTFSATPSHGNLSASNEKLPLWLRFNVTHSRNAFANPTAPLHLSRALRS